MKNVYTLLTIAILALGVSCSDDFTTVDPVGSLSDAALANATGVDLLLTGAYSVLDGVRNGGNGNGWGRSADNWVMDVISDDAHKGSTDGDQADLYELEVYNWQTGNGYFLARWEVLYAGVNRANAVISLINNSDSPSDFGVELAQAYFLRGHFNFELKKIYENVPFISQENYDAQEFSQPNSGATAVSWAVIESDFSYAKDNLPASRGGNYVEAGRPLAATAQAFLGKAQLYQSKWSDALGNLDAVISSGKFSLAADFMSNWTSSGENGSEAMFAIQYSADNAQSKQGNATGALNHPGGGPFGSCCGFYQPTQDLLDAYQTSSGLPVAISSRVVVTSDYGVASADAFTPYAGTLDPRADFTVGRRGIDYNGYGPHIGKDWIRASFDDISGPYLPKKNTFQKTDTDNQGSGGWGEQLTGINYHIMRYADVLLMAAEAAVESGDEEKARGYVNKVRQRALNSTTIKATDGSDAANYDIGLYNSSWVGAQSAARTAVRTERRLEFGMEGHRSFDLRRWGVAETVMNNYITRESQTITSFAKGQAYQGKHNMFPIPLSAIDGSGGVISQNSGF
tara:strand:- start:237 stop:1946 length:1710 start_codon:yes stop_codon:yes gene_type:complete